MEIREYAWRVVAAETLEEKLAPPPCRLEDDRPGSGEAPAGPGRPPELGIAAPGSPKTPRPEGMADPAQKVRILAAFANHELQAAELFALALLRFPAAPAAFRRGLLRILAEEQVHCRLYIDRLSDLGGRFGEHPVSGYFWGKAGDLKTPLRFVCAMGLTFEAANLDHALDYAAAARRYGDEKTAAILTRVHEEEIGHVRFAWRWLARLKDPARTMEEAYRANVTFPLRPALAKGPVFYAESRRRAGLDESFLAMVREADPRSREP